MIIILLKCYHCKIKMKLKRLGVILGLLFLITLGFGIVSADACWVGTRGSCVGNDNIVMGLSGLTNAHAQFYNIGTYDYVLCCDFGGTYGCDGDNKIVGLSFISNAHAQVPEDNNYGTDVCYNDLICESNTGGCSAGYDLEMVSLSSETNAHVAEFGHYDTKVCCMRTIVSECGNNIIEAGEVCDGNSQGCMVGDYSGTQDCNSQCTGFDSCETTEFCGDGIVNGNEECDDGNSNNNDGCSAVCEIEDLIPSVVASANPTSGVEPLDVQFNCQGIGGNGVLEYDWEFGDGQTSTVQNPQHTYYAGDYVAECTATDEDGDSDTALVNIQVVPRELEIVDITCFDPVIENNDQLCGVDVENALNLPEPGVDVDIYYSDGSLFGSCVTDSISGGCDTRDLQTVVGPYEVYAIATKDNYISDDDTYPRFNYDVLEEVYLIENLMIFNDDGFTNEDYDFFRGEDLFVSFRVTRDGVPIGDMVTRATLVSGPGDGIDLTEISNSNGDYFYELSQIPLTHEFFGDSQIFAFAFDFADGSGGQAEVDLIIRNNAPIIVGVISNQNLKVGEMVSIDLSLHESDDEDSGDGLRWEVENSSLIETNIVDKTLFITGVEEGEGSVMIRLYDWDNDFDEQLIGISVGDSGNGGGTGDRDKCKTKWKCSDWNKCINEIKTRDCVDLNNCGSSSGKPTEIMECGGDSDFDSLMIDLGASGGDGKVSNVSVGGVLTWGLIIGIIIMLLIVLFYLWWR